MVLALKNWTLINTYYFPIDLEGSYFVVSATGDLIYFIGDDRKIRTNVMYRLNVTTGEFDKPIVYNNTWYVFAAKMFDNKIYSVMGLRDFSLENSKSNYGVYFWIVTDLQTMKYSSKSFPLYLEIDCIGII